MVGRVVRLGADGAHDTTRRRMQLQLPVQERRRVDLSSVARLRYRRRTGGQVGVSTRAATMPLYMKLVLADRERVLVKWKQPPVLVGGFMIPIRPKRKRVRATRRQVIQPQQRLHVVTTSEVVECDAIDDARQLERNEAWYKQRVALLHVKPHALHQHRVEVRRYVAGRRCDGAVARSLGENLARGLAQLGDDVPWHEWYAWIQKLILHHVARPVCDRTHDRLARARRVVGRVSHPFIAVFLIVASHLR